MESKKRLPYKRAIRTIRTLISENKHIPGYRLPNIQSLAARAKVSFLTMWSAVQFFKHNNILNVKHRSGITINNFSAEKIRNVPKGKREKLNNKQNMNGPKWKQLCIHIERDIFNGTYRYESFLPSTKDLISKYKVSYHTIQKALKALTACKRLSCEYNKYRVVSYARSNQKTLKIMVISQCGRIFSYFPYAVLEPRQYVFLRMLEQECSRQNISLLSFIFDSQKGEMQSTATAVSFKEEIKEENVAGLFLAGLFLSSPVVGPLVEILSTVKKPIAYLNEFAITQPLPPVLANNKSFKTFYIGLSERSGNDVGRFLLDLGHKKIAYISFFHAEQWSIDRYKGLQSAYATVNLNDTIISAVMALERPELVESIIFKKFTKPNVNQIAFEETLNRSIPLFIDYYMPQVSHLLEELIKYKNLTAWVAANDLIALICFKWMRQHGIKVPEQISLIGFDDTEDCFAQNISSYNFCPAECVSSMLSYVLWSKSGRNKIRDTIFDETPGYVVARGSTGRVLSDGQGGTVTII